jgi:oligopeptide transport system permease protein
MSKYSIKDKLSKKLEDSIAESNAAFTEKDDLTAEEMAKLTPEDFDFAEYDETAAERAGYSNYSYWRSTVRVFLKNKVAVTNLIIMLVLVIFTFIQPILPNQFDPNLVNKYDDRAVWVTVSDDGKTELSGIKYTSGDYAVETDGRNTTLAYVKAPSDWGHVKFYVQEKGGTAEEITSTEDPNNAGWYYGVVSSEKPYMYVTSEDGTKTTYFEACWITVDEETTGVTSSSSKQTTGDLIADVPEGCVLTYIKVPDSWGTPTVTAASIMRGSESVAIELTPLEGEGNEGWYYAFVPSEQMMLDIVSEDGQTKGMNKGVARVTDPSEITPQVGFISNQSPNSVFWFGTNDIGQDLWSRMWSGTRTSLFIGIIVAAIEAVVGILVGLLWGYVRKLDFLFTEIYNVINNIPSTIILILASYVMRPSVQTIIIAMSITGWIGLARFIRNQVIIIRDRDFNLASRCLGTPTRRVIIKNLLPQMVSVVMLRMALAIPGAIGSEVFLAYIGLGLPIDTPSLGNLVNKGRSLMMAPSLRYQLIVPAIILSVITICFYLVGNAFSDAADPKNHV